MQINILRTYWKFCFIESNQKLLKTHVMHFKAGENQTQHKWYTFTEILINESHKSIDVSHFSI